MSNLKTTITVTNGSPGTVRVTVAETTGSGGDVTFNVHVVSNLRLATPYGKVPAPATGKVSASAVSWLKQKVAQGSSTSFNMQVSPNFIATSQVCSTVSSIVTLYGQTGYYDVQKNVVCCN
jgi:hypothetical protein